MAFTLTQTDVANVQALQADGRTLDQIAALFGITRRTFSRALTAAGVSPPRFTPHHRHMLSLAQLRWLAEGDNRAVDAARKQARRISLQEDELRVALAERRKGRRWDIIADRVGVARRVLTREVRMQGHDTAKRITRRRATRTAGFWGS